MELYQRVQEFNGGDTRNAHKYRGMLLEAGFARSELHADLRSFGSEEATRQAAGQWHIFFRAQFRTALEQGWIDEAKQTELLNDLTAWGPRPEAYASSATMLAIAFA